jgi:translation elongation factor EF-1alpha
LLSWYGGRTVLQELDLLCQNVPDYPSSSPLFGCIDREFTEAGAGVPGVVVRAKLFSGQVSRNGAVAVSPVEVKHKCCSTLTARVRNIRDQSEQDTDRALAGCIAGLLLDDFRVAGRRVKDEDVSILRTSCLFDVETKVRTGTTVVLDTGGETDERIQIGEQVALIWFGKTISSKVIARRHEGRAAIVAEVEQDGISLPEAGGATAAGVFAILKHDGTYIQGRLEMIGVPLQLRWRCADSILSSGMQFGEFAHRREGNEVVFSDLPRYGPVVAMLRHYAEGSSSGDELLVDDVSVALQAGSARSSQD